MGLLIQVPSTVSSFTDDDPPVGLIYYQLGLSNPDGCSPTKKSDTDYSSSISNMEQVKNTLGIVPLNIDDPFTIYPNPAGTDLNIQLHANFLSPVKYEVFNLVGSMILEGIVPAGSYRLNTSSYSAGIYILKLSNQTASYTARFMILEKE